LLYTCFFDTIALYRIVEKNNGKEIKIDSGNSDLFINALYEAFNDLMLFQSHIGRVSEIIRKEIPGIVNGINGKDLLQKYFDSRNNYLHSQRIPISITDENIILIPKFSAQDKSKGWKHKEGNNYVVWRDVNPSDFQFISDYYKEFFEEFLKELNTTFEIILSKIPDKWKDKKIVLKDENHDLLNDNSKPFSISGETPGLVNGVTTSKRSSQKRSSHTNNNLKRRKSER
jgi:hypothetical protein